MFINLNQKVDIFTEYDYCIIGSGPAGISLALELSKDKNKSILMAEAGGIDFSQESSKVYSGNVIGDKYFSLEAARQRFFGGTSNHWGGWCRPLDKIDFKYKTYSNNTGWPISKKDLDPFLDKACNILEIDHSFDDRMMSRKFSIQEIDLKNSPPVRFATKFYRDLKDSTNVTVLLNANLANLNFTKDKIISSEFKSYTNQKVDIFANKFILATGGIENSRLLLCINKINNGNLYSKSMPVGNYWMEHPHFTIGDALIDSKWADRYFSLVPAKIKELKIMNACIRFEKVKYARSRKLVADLACVAPSLGRSALESLNKNIICGVRVKGAWEQEPIFKNSIELSKNKTDIFNMPRTNLFWKKSLNDFITIQKTIEQFNKWIMNAQIGRLHLFDWILGKNQYPENDELAGYHHMGGTRMSVDPSYGVVDSNLKMFGKKNMYIAGSSTFPTGGHANPTLTIVQLSLRLANHLKVNK